MNEELCELLPLSVFHGCCQAVVGHSGGKATAQQLPPFDTAGSACICYHQFVRIHAMHAVTLVPSAVTALLLDALLVEEHEGRIAATCACIGTHTFYSNSGAIAGALAGAGCVRAAASVNLVSLLLYLTAACALQDAAMPLPELGAALWRVNVPHQPLSPI